MASLSLQPGQVVGGRYRLGQMIGVGGMGAVWSAHDLAAQSGASTEVAVKFLHPALLRDPLVVQRFVQEALVGIPLRHPCIIETYDSGRYQPPDAKEAIPYLVTELLDGEPLSDTLRRVEKLPLGCALVVMADVARAAHAAHVGGILHRDLKPANVFLHRTRGGGVIPKVLDFGISKALDPALDVGLTTTGMLVGSPSYMSPEQALGKRDVDARSDVWSIGVMLHRALTGQSLFPTTGAPGMLKHIVEQDVTLDATPDVPPQVLLVLSRCLRRDRRERFASADELATALEALRTSLGLQADLGLLLDGSDLATTTSDGGPRERGDDAPDGPTLALAREETETRLAVAVPSRRATSWALPVAGALTLALLALFVANRALWPAVVAPSPPAAASVAPPLPTDAAASIPPVSTSAPAPPLGAEPVVPAPAAAPRPPSTPPPRTPTPASSARRVRQVLPPKASSDVTRQPGF